MSPKAKRPKTSVKELIKVFENGDPEVIRATMIKLKDSNFDNQEEEVTEDLVNTCLRGACKGGHLELVKFIMENIIFTKSWNVALGIACEKAYIPIIEYIISKGANSLNEALLIAYQKRQYDAVELLLSKGAIVDVT